MICLKNNTFINIILLQKCKSNVIHLENDVSIDSKYNSIFNI